MLSHFSSFFVPFVPLFRSLMWTPSTIVCRIIIYKRCRTAIAWSLVLTTLARNKLENTVNADATTLFSPPVLETYKLITQDFLYELWQNVDFNLISWSLS